MAVIQVQNMGLKFQSLEYITMYYIYLKLKTEPFMLTMCLLDLRKFIKDEMYVYVFIIY